VHGPLLTPSIFDPRPPFGGTGKAHSEFESGGRGIRPPRPQSLALPHRSGRNCRCDPEGTFGGNQQLTDSMSLSPLHPSETSDLHVNKAYQPPMQFPASSMSWGEVRRFSGISLRTLPRPLRAGTKRARGHPLARAPPGPQRPVRVGPGRLDGTAPFTGQAPLKPHLFRYASMLFRHLSSHAGRTPRPVLQDGTARPPRAPWATATAPTLRRFPLGSQRCRGGQHAFAPLQVPGHSGRLPCRLE